MTLSELSNEYRASAQLLSKRLGYLRKLAEKSEDPEEIWQLNQRIRMLTPILTEMNELAELTAHYYDRGYWRNEKYTV